MLPLHTQDTMARQYSNASYATGDVFDKEAGFVFPEFFLPFLIFPWVYACVGLTVYLINNLMSSCIIYC